MTKRPTTQRQYLKTAIVVSLLTASANCIASDHLDTRTVVANPQSDIGDLYAWSSADGKRLNLAITIVAHQFSRDLNYTFHVDSGSRFGQTTASTEIVCRFPSPDLMNCRLGSSDYADGYTERPEGIEGRNGRFKVFAGVRDDPFFNNVKGARDAYQVAAQALNRGTAEDSAGCPLLTKRDSSSLLHAWGHTDGGPAQDFLKDWTPASLVVSVDLDAVDAGGRLLAVWATTSKEGEQIDRIGRPLTGNAMLAPLAADEVSDALKEKYNTSAGAELASLVPPIQNTLGLYDSFDGVCGNQLMANHSVAPPLRYRALAELLADDRLWVNGNSRVCKQFFAVELAHLDSQVGLKDDCGGRTPTQDAVDVYRSLLVNGTVEGVDDGVDRDDKDHSDTVFPYLIGPGNRQRSKH